jgi:hypothetical protein
MVENDSQRTQSSFYEILDDASAHRRRIEGLYGLGDLHVSGRLCCKRGGPLRSATSEQRLPRDLVCLSNGGAG